MGQLGSGTNLPPCGSLAGGGPGRSTAAQEDTSNAVRKNIDRNMVYDEDQFKAGQASEAGLTGVMALTDKKRGGPDRLRRGL